MTIETENQETPPTEASAGDASDAPDVESTESSESEEQAEASDSGQETPETQETAPDDDAPPPPGDKRRKAAKKGHRTRADRAKRRSDLAEDDDVRKLLDEAVNRGRDAARADAEESAKRASMSELERAQAERDDAIKSRAEIEVKLQAEQSEREYAQTMIELGTNVRAKARGTVHGLVRDAMQADPSLTHRDAIEFVLQEHDYLIEPAVLAASTAANGARRGSTTAPAPRRETASPAEATAKKPVDVSAMTKQQFQEYRASQHGIRVPH